MIVNAIQRSGSKLFKDSPRKPNQFISLEGSGPVPEALESLSYHDHLSPAGGAFAEEELYTGMKVDHSLQSGIGAPPSSGLYCSLDCSADWKHATYGVPS